jgi:6-phosphogluconolactonase
MERTDIVLVGMGDDGHTASLFPNDVASEHLLKSDQKGIFYTSAPNHPKDRITCSPAIIEAATHCVLLMHGSKKREVLQKSGVQNLPIARFTNCPNFQLYYSKS